MNEVIEKPRFSLEPQNFDDAWKFAEIIASSDLVPKDFKNKPGNVLVAMQMGAELGLPIMQAIQNIAVINGRPSLWGDALLALVKASPLCEYFMEEWDEATQTATARTLRNGDPSETVRTFSMDDAKMAALSGKQGPWRQYPRRMCQMRARGFCARDAYPDVLKGIGSAEEQTDTPRLIGSGSASPDPEPTPDKRIEAPEKPTGDDLTIALKSHAEKLDSCDSIETLKSAFTEAYRWARGVAKSKKYEDALKSIYDYKKEAFDKPEPTPEHEPKPEPAEQSAQSTDDWLSDLGPLEDFE